MSIPTVEIVGGGLPTQGLFPVRLPCAEIQRHVERLSDGKPDELRALALSGGRYTLQISSAPIVELDQHSLHIEVYILAGSPFQRLQ